ncbi:SDR family NAD(P)-dependent oxidoreductase [Streptomyces sp. NPDC048514]|uniref:SDR family NAD(P)-dependent oxidoreductase n=1 Tax=Streptomyces sp. NPDC048514 TaxID=3365564 RepID=UPI00371252E0
MRTKDLLLALQSGKIGLDEARDVLTSQPGGAGPAGEPLAPPEAVAPGPATPRGAYAVIGMSGRYPGAEDLGRYWRNLRAGKSSVAEVPAGRWDTGAYYDPRRRQPGRTDCKWLGALSDVDAFDAAFFGIPQAEAHAMDPQHRLFLQEAFHAFEDAGYGRERLDGHECGVYLGLASHEYESLLARHAPGAVGATGTNGAIAAARIAYHLGLTGPAMAVDAACTSSLVAVHLACQALGSGETDLALAGGVSLYLGPDRYVSMSAAGMLSPTGQCRPFDARADGFVPGEGVGALVLKRLDDAERDGDAIHGVILATAVNQNGSTNGITAPSRRSQARLIGRLYAARGIDPAGIGYVEAHATGTTMGDFIELDALSSVFRKSTEERQFCAVGSVKGNIGHATAAAGVAGLHKVLLSLRHRTLVPTLHVEEPNQHFDFASSPFYLNTRTRPWDAPAAHPRRACVSAFGFSGSNAHIVLEEYVPAPAPRHRGTAGGRHLFVLSARTPDALTRQAGRLRDHLAEAPGADVAATAHTLQTGREAMDARVAFTAASHEELLRALDAYLRAPEGEPGAAADGVFRPAPAGGRRLVPEHERHRWAARATLPELAQAWVDGADFSAGEWSRLHDGTPRRAHLPGYPFAQEKYWYTAIAPAHKHRPAHDSGTSRAAEEPGTYRGAEEPGASRAAEERRTSRGAEERGAAGDSSHFRSEDPYVRDHTVAGVPTLIGMTHASLALDWFFDRFPQHDAARLSKLTFLRAVEVPAGTRAEVRLETEEAAPGADVHVRAVYRHGPHEPWVAAAECRLREAGPEPATPGGTAGPAGLPPVDPELLYGRNPAIGIGDTFRTFAELYAGEGTVVAAVDTTGDGARGRALDPLLVYSAFQAALLFLGEDGAAAGSAGYLPFGIEEVHARRAAATGRVWLAVRLRRDSGELIVFDADLTDDSSQVVARLTGCSMKRIRTAPDAAPTHGDLLPGIRRYLTDKLVALLDDPAHEVDPRVNLMDLGATSAQLVALTKDIEQDTGLDLSPALFFEYPSLAQLADHFHRDHREVFAARLDRARTPAGTAPAHPSRVPAPADTGHEAVAHEAVGHEADGHEAAGRRAVGHEADGHEAAGYEAAGRRAVGHEAGGHEDIAVIGMHAMLPGASNLDEFWRNLVDRTDVISEIPRDHWDYRPWFDATEGARDKTYCKWGGFIEDVDAFDAEFFRVSPREAEWMDPQLRLLLQSVYATAEDAGAAARLRGSDTGVFVGVCCHDYLDVINERRLPVEPYAGLGNHHTVLANRVSFAFDLHGPSVAVDTACSSSLVALHQACQALRGGECETAFVGGVNLLLSSYHYRFFSSVGALSPTGRCHTFDETADGYVPGECIASVLLKPLSRAVADGDRIHAVIKGSAVRHGGYTPSFTAPSVEGEENAVVRAWQDAGVPPETISYIEAHGTGTKLGDPIEITALNRAFRRYTERERFCTVGSVKANIGHTEGAAGLAGLLKVILQLRHRQIPPLPRLRQHNPLIKWDGGALRVNPGTQDWVAPDGAPLRAGISSFGISGAYAHVVVEEHVPAAGDRPRPAAPAGAVLPVAVVLSARDEDRLRERARQLAGALRDTPLTDADLPDLAYTLQTGREALRERMGCVVSSVGELAAILDGFAAGHADGRVHRGRAAAGAGYGAVAGRVTAGTPSPQEYAALLETWVGGGAYDWESLHRESRPRLIGLPTYPFARDRYWLADAVDAAESAESAHPANAADPVGTAEPADTAAVGPVPDGPGADHPMLPAADPDSGHGRFRPEFAGTEFFLADHRVLGRRILPGAAHLELARAAVHRHRRAAGPQDRRLRLADVAWTAPAVAEEGPLRLEVTLTPGPDGGTGFAVHGAPAAPGATPVLHCRGRAVPLTDREAVPDTLDLAAVRTACSVRRLTAEQCYDAFGRAGMEYGPAFRGIEHIDVGTAQALARLRLPDEVRDTAAAYELHPSLVDSALQAVVGLMLPSDGTAADLDGPALPFSVDEVDVLAPSRTARWARVRERSGTKALRTFDVDVCDEDGVVCVRIRGAACRTLREPASAAPDRPGDEAPMETVLAAPVWDAVTLDDGVPAAPVEGRTVLACADRATRQALAAEFPDATALEIPADASVAALRELLRGCGPVGHLVWVAPLGTVAADGWGTVPPAQREGTLQLFRLIKAALELDYAQRELTWTVVTRQSEPCGPYDTVDPTHAGVHGLAGSLADEQPGWRVRTVDLPADGRWPDGALLRLPPETGADVLALRSGAWHRRRLIPVTGGAPGARTGYRHGGVYLVIGGAGGLGDTWSEYLVRTYRAQIVWIGRRPQDADITRKLDRLARLGPRPLYLQADATDEEQLSRARRVTLDRFGALHGVVHAAISLLDRSLAQMSEERFRAGYAAKLDVGVAMARVFGGLPLDFVLFFSSMASFVKGAGQANYAAGCAFKDALAHRLAQDWPCAVKVVNWGYWGSVGVVASAAYRERMAREGIGSIEPAEGMAALEFLLSSPFDRLALLKVADPGRVGALDMTQCLTATPVEEGPAAPPGPESVLEELRELAGARIGERIQAPDDARELTAYGFGPAQLTELAERIGERYRMHLTQAAFIDHPTLPELARHIAGRSTGHAAATSVDASTGGVTQ